VTVREGFRYAADEVTVGLEVTVLDDDEEG
jgi:hypothetical protein